MKRPSPRWALLLSVILVAVLFRFTDTNPAMAQTQRIGAWRVSSQPVMDGFAPEWQSIVPVFIPATAQQVTPPMGGGMVERIAVRAVHWEDRLYIMLEWNDATSDLLSDGHEVFTDSAAIQFPAIAGSEVPYICMGQADQAVNIWQWRADHQTEQPGLPENGYVDLYPSTDDLYFPARAAGNSLADRSPAQNLVAGGFGTLTASENGGLEGHGVHHGNQWAVVFSRPFQSTGDLQPDFAPSELIDVAFAVWDGSRMERDGIKSVSAFTQLSITSDAAPRRSVGATGDWPAYSPPPGLLGIGLTVVVLLLIATIAAWAWLPMRHALRHAQDHRDEE